MKYVLTVALICLFTTTIHAESHFHLGGRFAGSYNMIWNVDNSISSNDIIGQLGIPVEALAEEKITLKDMDQLAGTGATFGITLMYQPTPIFSIQPELLFSYRDRSIEPTAVTEYVDSGDNSVHRTTTNIPELEISQWFFEIPVLLRFQTPIGLFFNAGPVISLNMSTDFKAYVISMDAGDYVATMVFGMLGGLGYSFKLGNGQTIDIDLRMQLGLSSIIKDNIEIPTEEITISVDPTKIVDPRDFNISLGIAYWFL